MRILQNGLVNSFARMQNFVIRTSFRFGHERPGGLVPRTRAGNVEDKSLSEVRLTRTVVIFPPFRDSICFESSAISPIS